MLRFYQKTANFTKQPAKLYNEQESRGGEMVDTIALGAIGSNPVQVQVLFPAPLL